MLWDDAFFDLPGRFQVRRSNYPPVVKSSQVTYASFTLPLEDIYYIPPRVSALTSSNIRDNVWSPRTISLLLKGFNDRARRV